MSTAKFAVFVDLENAGAKVAMLNSIIEKVKMRGDILIGKVYGYTEEYSDLKQVLLSNTFTVVPSLRFGHNQKNNLDIQLVIDALDVAYTNMLIDSFCIVSGDSDYTPLVGKLKTMGKTVLGISRSEVASTIFINACNEFVFLESVGSRATPKKRRIGENGNGNTESAGSAITDLNKQIEAILTEQADEDGALHASELKNTLLRLRPDFNERNYGCASFGKLMGLLEAQCKTLLIEQDHFALKVRLRNVEAVTLTLTKENWMEAFQNQLDVFKENGFERINPSILKAAIQTSYPTFEEKQIGYKRFSDMLKRLEKEKRLLVELDDAGTMLIKIL